MDFSELTPELKERMKACKTEDDLVALASEQGIELSDEQLEAIAGGSVWSCEANEGNSSGT